MLFSFSSNIAEITNGIPNPKEYAKSKNIPCSAVSDTDAIIKAEPKKAPIQGVKFIEKIIPNKKAENISFILCFIYSFKKR